MERHEDSIPPNPTLYPEELQLKLYQAFIFSIPLSFSIIVFLLFYLFYFKRRTNNMSSHSLPIQQSTNNQSTFPPWNLGIKGELIKEKLQVVEFDEALKAKDSICCVCLGEFEMNEVLRQLPLCKHVFHGDCIRHWLRANATCPLCRCPLIPASKMRHPTGLGLAATRHDSAQQQPRENVGSGSSMSILSTTQEHVVQAGC